MEKELAMILSEMMPLHDTDFRWQSKAACRGMDTSLFFFEGKYDRQNIDKLIAARKICGTCKVRKQCLEFAVANEIPDGVWGGVAFNQGRTITGALRQRTA